MYSLFLRKCFRHNCQLSWYSKFQDVCFNFPSHFLNDEFLPFFAIPLTIAIFFCITFEIFLYLSVTTSPTINHYVGKSLELPPLRPYATRTPQTSSFDTTSDVPLQTILSASDVIVNTHNIGIIR